MVGDGGAVHAKLLHPADVFLYFVGAVKQTVLRMNMKMRKCHVYLNSSAADQAASFSVMNTPLFFSMPNLFWNQSHLQRKE